MRKTEPGRSGRGRIFSHALIAALGGVLVLAATVMAVAGLQNSSFESGSGNSLDNWVLKTVRGEGPSREVVYGPGAPKGPVPCEPGDRYGICVIEGSDVFTDQDTGQTHTVTPVDGEKMVRLGGPYTTDQQVQNNDAFQLQQTFTVDPANPVLELNYNLYTYDYSGFDEARFIVKLTDEDGEEIVRDVHGAFGSGTQLKTSGWRPNGIDLSGYGGQQVHLSIESQGTSDDLFGFWTYVDAGLVPEPPVSGENADASAPPLPGGGEVTINKQTDPSTGQGWFMIPTSQVSQFDSDCMPLTVTVPIEAGAGTVSNVNLVLNGMAVAMNETAPGSGTWTATIACVENGNLSVSYDLSEGGVTQTFTVPLGGIVLIDPQGVVYDKAAFNAAKAANPGLSDADARDDTAIEGATVRLQRRVGANFANVLSGDPGISPNVNPQITPANGLYQWDVAAGTYRVVAYKAGFAKVVSQAVDIPPPVLDLHIPLEAFQTSITSGPSASTTDKTPTFGFKTNDPVSSTFQCKVDGGAFAPCTSSFTTSTLSTGAHTFSVRGTDSEGFTDATAATRAFTVKDATISGGGDTGGGGTGGGTGGGDTGGGDTGGGGTGGGDTGGGDTGGGTTDEECSVPDLKGAPLAGIEAALEEANCTLGEVTKQQVKKGKSGVVLSQQPAAGEELAVGSAVDVTVSERMCKVPKLKGDKLSKAKRQLKKAGCRLGKVKKKKVKKGKSGRVAKQKPKAGKTLPAGSKVNLTVTKKK